MLKDHYIFSLSIIIPHRSASAAATNGLSLSYFIRCGRGGLGNKLLIFLNVLDLLYCVSMTVSVGLNFVALSRSNEDFIRYQAIYLKSSAIKYMFEEGTGFATLLLSVTRCISMYNPFYRIRTRPIVIASLVFFLYLLAKNSAFIFCFERSQCQQWNSHDNLEMQIGCEMMIIIVVVLISNVIAVSKLRGPPRNLGQERETSNRQITLTVFTLSAVFCCLNAFKYSVVLAVRLSTDFPFETVDNLAKYVAIPLNSALNPVIYTVRTRSMRQYALDLLSCSGKRPRGSGSYPLEIIGSTHSRANVVQWQVSNGANGTNIGT